MPKFSKRFQSKGQADGDKKGGSAFQPDLAMTFMLIGAFFKFLELIVIRDGINRYMCAAVGGLMIAVGSGLVTWNSLAAIWQASRDVSALKESITTGGTTAIGAADGSES